MRNNNLLVEISNLINQDYGKKWLMKMFLYQNEDIFVDVAKGFGYPVITQKMDARTAAAMWLDAGITTTAQRIIT